MANIVSMEWTAKDVRTWKREDRGGIYFVKVPGTSGWRSSGKTKKSHAVEWALHEAYGVRHPDTTFGEYAKDFFIPGVCRRVALIDGSKGVDRANSPGHWDQLRQILVDYVMPKWAKTPLAMISPSAVYTWLQSPDLVTVRQSGTAPRPVSRVWRNRILTVMNQVFKQATFEQVLSSNPLESVPRLALDTKKKGVFTDDEMRRLFPSDLTELDRIWAGRIWALIGMVQADTGMRPGEVLALRKRHWHPSDLAFVVSDAVKEDGKIGPLKTARTGVAKRATLVSTRTTALLESWAETLEPDDLLFASFKFKKTRGQPMRTVTVTHHFEDVLTRAEIPQRDRTPYSFRHNANTEFRTNLDDEATRLLMGHTTTTMTDNYDNPEEKALVKRVRRTVERARTKGEFGENWPKEPSDS